MQFKILAVALGAIMTIGGTARADDSWMEQVMTFTMEGDHIRAEGAFVPDTSDTFNRFLAEHAPADGPWNTALYIRSPGGALGAAIDMGRALRARGMSVVAYDLCASACTYMLMGGVHRVVTREARYGVHQFSFDTGTAGPDAPLYTAKDVETHQIMVGELADYADTMGVDPRVVALASRTPPADMTFLTRQQLVKFNVDNVPTDDAEGQSNDDIVIPGVIERRVALPDTGTSIFESLQIKPHRIASTIAVAMARRLVMAETLDLEGMEQSLANSYAENVEYNGHVMRGEDLVAQKRRMVGDWGVRRRTVDEDSLEVDCEVDDLWCTVSGEYDYELGLAEGGFISKNRWRFSMDIMMPLVYPRVSQETVRKAN